MCVCACVCVSVFVCVHVRVCEYLIVSGLAHLMQASSWNKMWIIELLVKLSLALETLVL